MLSLDDIKQLIELIDESQVDEFELETKETKIRLKKNNGTIEALPPASVSQAPVIAKPSEQVVEAPEVKEEIDALEVITSPMVGTFYASKSPEDGPFVHAGSSVSKETVVCIVEAMKLFNEITADIEGEIAEVLVTNGELVEFGQPLFKVKKK
ncbi:acetyl-CoA carboxylase biotin carboxyl carrier protein [Listeria sp. PSOL-1]|uniref:acetyl-CoA carboxylase biotin carboxyl carrier protein n=1 Tax=Listeria sp. PSOL-1 TaxID=1844999 RepID=UPI0013D83A90|nr:acetyl-CoA carboxylase biotin carboxyl carrier protein [Listeria sp. PSOL-1]